MNEREGTNLDPEVEEDQGRSPDPAQQVPPDRVPGRQRAEREGHEGVGYEVTGEDGTEAAISIGRAQLISQPSART